ncbi:MAG: DNA mismatch repair endonuclease MutL [Planctomycetes bacterium]|nr:DNA mismatch repair endonuclease MutL [Planctomycetota bacterium]
MVNIRVLAPAVVSKIAAGEVVERPFSVLKELVENSIDAGATRIEIDLEEGGKSLLRIRDDGRGMSREDLELAFVQHATSKLLDVDDLDAIASLGFRGEALASIGSVSRARIVSREPNTSAAHEVRSEAGVISEVRPAAGPPGTLIEVRDLFYNVPARRRFLKTATAERARCVDVLTRAALAHRDTGFVLNGARGVDLRSKETLSSRVASLFGRELAERGLDVAYEQAGIRVEGLAIDPDGARRDRSQQYLFVNGRPFQDASLAHAIREAYREYLMPGKHPVVFLFLGLDPARVDVNVHPTKAEVRFVEGRLVFSAVRRALGAALATRSKRIVPRAAAAGVETPEPVTGFPELPRGLFGDDHGASKVGESRGGARVQLAPSDVASGAGALPTSGSVPADAQPRDDAEQTGRSIRSEDNPFRTVRRFLVVRDLYILFETDDGFAVVDQHALHERVVYEKLLAAWRSGSVPVQRLLVPEVVELPVIDKELLLEHEEGLANAGVLVRDFGGSSIKVEGVPAALRRANARSLVEGLVAELRLGEVPREPHELLERFHSRACRTAIMAGDRLTEPEIEDLLVAASKLEHPHNCPHGRPTVLSWSTGQLERFFKRRV